VIPASHPCISAELMLRHKGVPYKRRDLVMAMHKPMLRALGFSGRTVPALKASSVRLLMALDQLRPLIEARPAGELALKVVPAAAACRPDCPRTGSRLRATQPEASA
jgi:hypothetical protein